MTHIIGKIAGSQGSESTSGQGIINKYLSIIIYKILIYLLDMRYNDDVIYNIVGNVYEGTWKEGLMHGKGMYYICISYR
jgi:hypothetical protein